MSVSQKVITKGSSMSVPAGATHKSADGKFYKRKVINRTEWWFIWATDGWRVLSGMPAKEIFVI